MKYIIIIILFSLCIYEHIRKSRLKKEILNINRKLEAIIREENYKTLLLNCNNEETQGLILTINKLISEKRLEKSIREERDEKIKEMLANVSHDLKTPLTVILGYGEMINQDKDLTEGEKKELLEGLMGKTEEVVTLINKFFTLAKLESGDKSLEMEKVNLSEIIRESIIDFYEVLEKENFQVDINLPDEDIWVNGNKDALLRIFNNLISNVMRYGKCGKYLGINMEISSNLVKVEVIDKGQGVEEKEKEKIFERSYTGAASRNSEISGNGLGLTIVKSLVNSLGGDIQIHSIPYKETVFSFTLEKA
ncbi:HAMP domain-containing histidine kinase [Clostridium sp. MSJ-11]|uniref:histidine kinase n=1 Tax=Clostridium mobile TaxID=2841512 RepID=A0ABS6EGG2_9CLOT|nr:HAMP domain-containing sensor histidine kinase [Clostridium mobile]MBU5484308.1 HAMP domain-containing histidine kinase [Clostridium mobile]